MAAPMVRASRWQRHERAAWTLQLREIEDLSEGLKETVKAVAEELQIKPSIINKAIKIAHKDNWKSHEEEWDEIEMILGVTKRLPEW